MSDNMTDPLFRRLADVFGFRSFRPHQEEIVRAVLRRQDVFAVMPTGGGKSLCYQLPAKLMNGVCIVVSPLISLMKDQVDAAAETGLKAAALNSTIANTEQRNIGNALHRNEIDLLYISPERFNSPNFIDRLKTLNIAFFAVDEAHCISEWGHDFRPDYLALSKIADAFPNTPIAAFTATATARVAEDIVNRLKLRKPMTVRASFNRPNLFYRVMPKSHIHQQLREFLQKHPKESGIIYRQSRKNVEQTAEMLRRDGYSALPYHAGMSDADRRSHQEAFSKDECQIIVATIAFGMGIDKSNVRFVIHGDLPKNIEGYYQETGRSGRDGEPAECLLFYGSSDVFILKKFAEDLEDPAAKEIALQQLQQMYHYAANQSLCRRSMLLKYFGEEYPRPNCGGCDCCTDDAEREDATIPAQKVLSAIFRTGEKFGAGQIIDIVIGSDTEKIRQFRHNELPTYGVGKDKPKPYWKTLMNTLLAEGILTADDPLRPILKLTDTARNILKGKQPFTMVKFIENIRSRDRKTAADLPDLSHFGQSVSDKLRAVRMALAQASNVPPYVIFNDRSLHELALYLPQDREELLQVSGFGEHKAGHYGVPILSAIQRCCEENPEAASVSRRTFTTRVKSGTLSRPAVSRPASPPKGLSPSAEETLYLFNQGKTVEEIMSIRKFAKSTICGHIEEASQSGYEIDSNRFFVPERLTQIREWFAESIREAENLGVSLLRLKPAVEASGGQMDYDEARLARMFLQKERR